MEAAANERKTPGLTDTFRNFSYQLSFQLIAIYLPIKKNPTSPDQFQSSSQDLSPIYPILFPRTPNAAHEPIPNFQQNLATCKYHFSF